MYTFVETVPNATQAARRAGCSERIAYQTGHEWRHRPDVVRAVDLWIRERMQAVGRDVGDSTPEQQVEEVLRNAWLVARANILWFSRISEDRTGLIADLSHCTDEQLSVVESFDITERVVGEEVVERRVRLKLKDSAHALTLLARAAGLDKRQLDITGTFQVNLAEAKQKLLSQLCATSEFSASRESSVPSPVPSPDPDRPQ